MRLVSVPGWRSIAAAIIVFVPSLAQGQTTYSWNLPASGGSWQTGANWMPNSGAPVAITDIALFGNVATGANAVSLTGSVSIGELRFDGVTSGSATAAYTVGAAAQTITVNNGAAGITVWGATATTQTVATGVRAGTGVPLTIINNGASGLNTLTLSGPLSAQSVGSGLNVSGWSNTTISGAIGNSIGALTKSGPGVLNLESASAHAYTGGTFINGGTIRFTDNNQLGAAAGGVTLNGGTLHVAADIFVDRNITLNGSGGTIVTTVGSPLTQPMFRNPISGSGSLTFDGGSYVSLTANNTYTGATIINNAGVILGQPDIFSTIGRLSGTSSIQVNGFVGGQTGILDVRNGAAPNGSLINDGAAVTLNGGLLNYFTALAGDAIETFGSLHVNGFGALWGNISGGTGGMAFGNFTRTGNFSTLYVGGPINGGTFDLTFTGGITAPGGSGQTVGIVPWIGGDAGASGTATGRASTLYTYNASGLIALDTTSSTNFTQVSAGQALNGLFGDISNNAIIGNPQMLAGDVTILSLVQNVSSTAPSTISGAGILTVSTGAIANANQLVFNGPTVNFGSATGYLWLGNVMGVLGSSNITGSNGVVVTSMSGDGQNELRLQNTANTFSGGLYIAGTARVRFNASDAQLGTPGGIISLRGGTLWYNGGTNIELSTSGTPRPIELHSAGGGIIRVETAGVTLTVPGVVSGTQQLTTTGAGTVHLSNNANIYSGGTTIGDASLTVASAGSLGTGGLTFGVQIGPTTYSGGSLNFLNGGTFAGNVNNAFSGTINTVSNLVTFTGVISGPGALTKSGAGTLILEGANTYAGNTTVNAGTLNVENATGSGTGAGAVTVNTGATLSGNGSVAGAVTVNTGGTLRGGSTNGLGQLTLRGRTTLASGSTFTTTLMGTTPGLGYGQLVIAPGGSINLGGATFAPALNYTPTFNDRLFLIDNQTANNLTGIFNVLNQGDTFTFPNGTTAVISYFGDFGSGQISGGNDLVLHGFAPVPEPATVLGISALALGGAMWRRKRKVAV